MRSFDFDSFTGWGAPGWTQTPNEFYDLAPHLTEAELRVLIHIIRQTYGWHKRSDAISISQLVEATGMSRRGVINGTQGLKAKRLIEIETRESTQGDPATNVYSLRFSADAVQEVHRGSAPDAPPVGTKAHTQKKRPKDSKKQGSISKVTTEDQSPFLAYADRGVPWETT